MVSRGSGRLGACLLAFVSLLGAGLFESSLAGDPVGKAAIAFRGGFAGFDMGDVNASIDRSSRILGVRYPEWKLPERLHSGFGLGVDLSYDLTSNIRAGLVYGTTFGETSVDFLQTMKVRASSSLIMPRVLYRLPYRPMDDLSLRAFVGPVFLRGSKLKVEHENTSETDPRLDTMSIDGSGVGFAIGIAGEYAMADRFTIHFEGGYQGASAGFDGGSWRIEKQRDPGSNADANTGDTLPNNRDLPPESYLWGFLDRAYRQPADTEPLPRDMELNFSGYLLYMGIRVYLF